MRYTGASQFVGGHNVFPDWCVLCIFLLKPHLGDMYLESNRWFRLVKINIELELHREDKMPIKSTEDWCVQRGLRQWYMYIPRNGKMCFHFTQSTCNRSQVQFSTSFTTTSSLLLIFLYSDDILLT